MRRFDSFAGISVRRPLRKNVRSTASSSSVAAPSARPASRDGPDLLGGPAQRLGVESIGVSIVVHADDAGRGETVQVLVHPRDRARRSPLRARRGSGRPRARQPAIDSRSGSASARRISSGVSAMSVLLHTMPGCSSPTRSGAPSRASSAPVTGPRSRPISRSDCATASRAPRASWSSPNPCGSARRSSTSTGAARARIQAVLAGEAPPFAHSARSAHGVLLHKAIEVEVGARDEHGPARDRSRGGRARARARGAVRRVLARARRPRSKTRRSWRSCGASPCSTGRSLR